MLSENLMELVETLYLKGYLRYKIIFCHKVALDVWLMNCFIWRKNKFFGIRDAIIGIAK